jgi:hypothetical protein
MADVDVQCQFSGLIGILMPYSSPGRPADNRSGLRLWWPNASRGEQTCSIDHPQVEACG